MDEKDTPILSTYSDGIILRKIIIQHLRKSIACRFSIGEIYFVRINTESRRMDSRKCNTFHYRSI